MDQLADFADDRLIYGCVYCGAPADTRDHIPSRVLLDRPFPENLPVIGACLACNHGFSEDEEYMACLVDAVLAGTTDPDGVRRPVVAEIFRRSPKLQSRIEEAKIITGGKVEFVVEVARVSNVLLKLARGHVAYELSVACRNSPDYLNCGPLSQLSQEKLAEFEDVHISHLFSEVGSRGMQRLLVTQITLAAPDGKQSTVELLVNDWVVVQDGQYRYLACQDNEKVRVKIVIGEYLYCDVAWHQDEST